MVQAMTEIHNEGELVMVGHGEAVVVSGQGKIKTYWHIPHAQSLLGVAIQGHTAFVTDIFCCIHVVLTNGTLIKSVNTPMTSLYKIAILGSTLFITTDRGVYTFRLYNNYNIIDAKVFLPRSPSCKNAYGIAVRNSLVVVVCRFSHNFHILDLAGNHVVPPVDGKGTAAGKLFYPTDVTTDKAGRIYILDRNRVVLFSSSGQFIRILVNLDKGLNPKQGTLYIQKSCLYIANYHGKLYVIELE